MTNTSSSAHNICKAVSVVAILLVLALGVLTYKYMALKNSWRSYAVQSLQSMDHQRSMNSGDDAALIATTVGSFPGINPLYKQPKEVAAYVVSVAKQTRRDIVVVDTKKMILGDAIAANIGKKFAEDKAGEINKTLTDGITRVFVEQSTDYPQGIHQTVVPVKNSTGAIVGAVVISSEVVGK